jgi:serine/threonine protein kinase
VGEPPITIPYFHRRVDAEPALKLQETVARTVLGDRPMDNAPSGHPTHVVLKSFRLGKLETPVAHAVSKHLERCPECRKHVAGLSWDSSLGPDRDDQATDRSDSGKLPSHWSQNKEGSGAATPVPALGLPAGLAGHPDFEIKRELGRGAMGVVYLAHNHLMGRDEVLKVMGPHILERPGVLDRFLREIRAVARLRHPNIVAAYHAMRLGDSIVFAMEYVQGLDLSRMLKASGPLPVANACYFAYQTALGLQHAHDEGLVHRDIKPGNLMLTSAGDKAMIKILDFGIAKLTREETFDTQLTSHGQTLGTPDYIAPEQIKSAASADIRSDIYSLGGTLYHLLSGRPPFQTGSLYDTYQAHISRDAELLNFVRPEVPGELAVIVAKMMAKEPDRRFQSPKDVSAALKPMFATSAVSFATAATEVPRADTLANAKEPATEPERLIRRATKKRSATIPAAGRRRASAQPPLVRTDSHAIPVAKPETLMDRSAAELTDGHGGLIRLVAHIEPGARVILCIVGAFLLRILVMMSSAMTFGRRGATLDEARLSSMAVVFAAVGVIVVSRLGGREINGHDRFAIACTGGLLGVLIATVAHALIQSVEPVLGSLSTSVVAILPLWVVLGAAIGLVLAVAVPHCPRSQEIAS